MSKYLDNLKKFSSNKKLIYSEDRWLKAINHIEAIEKENKRLKAELNKLKEQK